MKKVTTFLMLGGLLFVLLTSISELPPMSDIHSPSNNDITQYYVTQAANDTGALNIVTAIIADYRSFDTLGEATVLFTGIVAVFSLVGIIDHKKSEEDMDE